jgi:protein required for attachment to host cells
MSTICVLVADSNCARIFEAESRKGSLLEQQTIVYPEARLPARELGADAPSSAFNSGGNYAGQSKHRIGNKTDIKKQQSLEFARDIVKQLKKTRMSHPFYSLVLIVPPKFLGTLRQELGDNLRNCISYELDKELTHMSAEEIRHHLPTILPLPVMV